MGIYIENIDIPIKGENRAIKAEIREVDGELELGIMTDGYYCCQTWQYYPIQEVPPHERLIEEPIHYEYGGLANIAPDDYIGIARYFANQVHNQPTIIDEDREA